MESLNRVYEALGILRDRVPRLVDCLALEPAIDLAAWQNALDSKLLPRFSPEFPLIVAVAGGGSSGKSTLFNALLGADVSPTGPTAGLTRRVLVGMNPRLLERSDFLCELFQPFRSLPEPLTGAAQAKVPGPPLYVTSPQLPGNLVLLDTPDFDVGARNRYLNRDAARPTLEASDVLLYIFTNATYNSLANGNFVREVATSVGRRKCVLVYRAYESYPREVIVGHAGLVAEKLYGDGWQEQLLGIYRAHDTNEVARGNCPMQLVGVEPGEPILDVLGRLDPRQVRRAHTAEALGVVASQADTLARQAETSRRELKLYADAVRVKQSHCVMDSLSKFPIRAVGARLQQLWDETGPPHVRAMRTTGRYVALPAAFLFHAVFGAEKSHADPARPPEDRLDDLRQAADNLYVSVLQQAIDSSTTRRDPDGGALLVTIDAVRGQRGLSGEEGLPRYQEIKPGQYRFSVAVHPALQAQRRRLEQLRWTEELAKIGRAAAAVLVSPAVSGDPCDRQLDAQLRKAVVDFRKSLSLWSQLRETCCAAVNVVPPIVAVTYVLATYDPVGGTTILAKLSGLFGMKDLLALVAIPVEWGLNEADSLQLEQLLKPVLAAWSENRSRQIDALFAAHVTGPLLQEADERIARAEELEREVRAALEALANAEDSHGT